ncbi:MAG: hemerythrin domain-containing protein [Nitrososphaerales archaeon]
MVLEHSEVFTRAEFLEKTSLECLENKKQLSREEYLLTVMPCRRLFKTSLAVHFRVEEMALFPILEVKSRKARRTISDLISEHPQIMQRFREYENIEDYDKSIKTMNDLMNTLSLHDRKENELFNSTTLSRDEVAKVDEIAQSIGFPIL